MKNKDKLSKNKQIGKQLETVKISATRTIKNKYKKINVKANTIKLLQSKETYIIN